MLKLVAIVLVCVALVIMAGALWFWTPDLPRQRLDAKYLRSRQNMREVAGTRLRIRDDGPRDAPVVIMLHGFGASLETWEAWSQALDDTFRVIRLDLPGSGLSPPDASGLYTDARAIQLVLALMDQLKIGHASLIGNSIGGRIAWTLAAMHPDRVQRLVLISPDGFAGRGPSYGQVPTVPKTLSLMRYFLPLFMVRSNLAVGYGDPSRLEPETVEQYYDLLRAPGARAALLARLGQTVLRDPEPLLTRIDSPTLLVWGEKDAMIPVSNAADYQRLLFDSELVTFAQLGHLPQEEAPAQSLPPVRRFLERVR